MIAELFNQLTEVLFAPLEGGINSATPAGILALGLVMGLRHAMEADHVAAVSTVVASSDKKLRRAPILGALWGLGHTSTLFIAALAVLLLAINIPQEVSSTLEFGVGIMLVLLGATTLTGFNTGKFLKGMMGSGRGSRHVHSHFHAHSGIFHTHDHSHHDHRHNHKSLIIGMVHGMAGSGALMLVVLTTVNSAPLGLAYIAIFGAGSIASMVAMSTLIGLPFAKAKHEKLGLVMKYASAVVAIAIGLSLVYDLGIAQKLLI